MRDRLIVFDQVRIIAITLIVFHHLLTELVEWPCLYDNPYIYQITPGNIGITLMLIASGAALAYNYDTFRSMSDTLGFYLKRLIRIYPAYIVSIVIGIALIGSSVFKMTLPELILQFTGFSTYLYLWGSSYYELMELITPTTWFIALIVILYLLYPLISKFLKWNPIIALAILFVVEFGTKYLFTSADFGFRLDYWFPLCRVFEFGLGVFIIQTGLYPRKTHEFMPLTYASKLSFYVFLIHYQLLPLALKNIPIYFVAVLVTSGILMSFDEKMQAILKRHIYLPVVNDAGAVT